MNATNNTSRDMLFGLETWEMVARLPTGRQWHTPTNLRRKRPALVTLNFDTVRGAGLQ